MINERRLTSGHRCPMMDGRRSRSLIISYFAIRTIIHPRYLQPVTDKSSVIIPESQHVCVCSRERKGLGRGGREGGRGKEENCVAPRVLCQFTVRENFIAAQPESAFISNKFPTQTNSSELRAIKNSFNLFSAYRIYNFLLIAKKKIEIFFLLFSGANLSNACKININSSCSPTALILDR